MPFLTRCLTTEDYGYTAIFSLLVSVLSPFIACSSQSSLSVNYYKKNIDFPSYMVSCFVVGGISSLFFLMVTLKFKDIIGEIVEFPADWLVSVVLVCICGYIISVFSIIVRVMEKPLIFIFFQISFALFVAISTFFLVIKLDYNWQGRVLAQVIVSGIFSIIGLSLLIYWRLLSLRINIDYIKKSLSFGIPLIIHHFSPILIMASSRFFIAKECGLDALGIFAVANQIGMVTDIIVVAFNNAYSPFLYKKLSNINNSEKTKLVKNTYCYLIGIFIISIFYALFSLVFFKYYVGANFANSLQYVIWFSLSGAFHGVYLMTVNYVIFCYKTKKLATITSFCAVLHIAISYKGIKLYGVTGAATSIMLTNMIMAICVWVLSNRIYPMPWLKFYKN